MKKLVCIVTGATSGIGKAIYEELRKQNHIVYSLSRRKDENINHIQCDLTVEEDQIKAINEIIAKEHRIDVLINCSGNGISGASEFFSKDDTYSQYNLNLLSTINFTNKVILHLRNNKSSKIIFISSIASICPIPYQAMYSSSKAAINAYAQALKNELKMFNIEVTSILLGDIKTNFTSSRRKIEIGDNIYQNKISKSVAKMEKDEQNGMNPSKIATGVTKIIKKKRLKVNYTIGFSYKIIALLMKFLPSRLSNYLIYCLYGK